MLWPKASPLDLDFGLCAWAKLFNKLKIAKAPVLKNILVIALCKLDIIVQLKAITFYKISVPLLLLFPGQLYPIYFVHLYSFIEMEIIILENISNIKWSHSPLKMEVRGDFRTQNRVKVGTPSQVGGGSQILPGFSQL